MRFSTFTALITLATAAMASGVSFPDHLSTYRTTHDLTPEQDSVITWAEDIVANSDTSALTDLKQACKDAFGDDEAVYILTGGSWKEDAASAKKTGRLTRRQRPECGCDSGDEWCGNGYGCKKYANNCIVDNWGGCGTLGLGTCDGQCVRV